MVNRNTASFLLLGLTICASLFFGCASKSPTVAGGGTDVSNAKISGSITTAGGTAVSRITVRLLPQDYNPLQTKDTSTDSFSYSTATDSNGVYSFSDVKSNNYAVYAVYEAGPDLRTSLYIPNIAVKNADTIVLRSDSLRKPGALFVALLPNKPLLPGAFLFIPGTDVYTRIPTTQSAVIIDHIPAGSLPSLAYYDYYSEEPTFSVAKNIQVQPNCTTAAGTATCLLICANSALAPAEDLIVSNIGRTGLAVVTKAESAVLAADCNNKDLVLISPLVSGASLGFLKTLSIPIITCQPATYPLLDMTGKIRGTDFTVYNKDSVSSIPDSLKLTIVEMRDVANPISPGLAGIQIVETDSLPMVWGRPNDFSKLVVSVYGDVNHVILFTYDIGAQMFTMQAPARRVAFSFHADAMVHFNALGWTLFENSIYWALRMR